MRTQLLRAVSEEDLGAQAGGEISKNKVAAGVFGADMKVSIINDGPVTFMLEVRPDL